MHLIVHVDKEPCYVPTDLQDRTPVPLVLWDANVHYKFNENQPLNPVLIILLNTIHTLTSYFLEICSNVILPSTR
jgi:hypothetical protein